MFWSNIVNSEIIGSLLNFDDDDVKINTKFIVSSWTRHFEWDSLEMSNEISEY